MFRNFISNTNGNFAITFAIALIPVVAAAGSAVDYSRLLNAEQEAQEALDSAVLAAMSASASEAVQIEIATKFFQSNIESELAYSNLTFGLTDSRFEGHVDVGVPTAFLGVVGIREMGRKLKSAATTSVGTGALRCIHALDRYQDKSLILNSKPRSSDVYTGASLTFNKCVVQVNSSSGEATALKAGSFSALENNFGGGFDGDVNMISPAPIIGANYMADPFASKIISMPAVCNQTGASYSGSDVIIEPGHYCGNFRAEGDNLTFRPGTYYFSGGDVEIGAENGIEGDGVTFITAANTGEFGIEADTLRIKATATGPGAAFVFFNQSNGGEDVKFKVTQYVNLEGIVYSPKSHFELRWSRPEEGSPLWNAPHAPFTAFIANTLDFHGYSQLILNNDQSATDLPIPAGLKTTAVGKPRLLY